MRFPVRLVLELIGENSSSRLSGVFCMLLRSPLGEIHEMVAVGDGCWPYFLHDCTEFF